MKGDGVGLTLGATDGGNCGVWVGVRGDESCAESGDESVSKTGGRFEVTSGSLFSWSRFGATDVTFESTPDPMPESRTRRSSAEALSSFILGDLIVLAFELFDFIDTFDRVSLIWSFPAILPNHELLDTDLASASTSSWTFDMRLVLCFLCCEMSVSGGLGGLPSF